MPAADGPFEDVFTRLRALLEPYSGQMHVSADDEQNFGVDTATPAERNPSTWFGAVRRGKRYVSIYLMPVYADPSVLDGASPELLRRKQGKSCFNFATVDDRLIGELAGILRRGYERTVGDPTWTPAGRASGDSTRQASAELEAQPSGG